MDKTGIEKIAHDFLRKGLVTKIDTEHSLETNGSSVVESFIARKGDPDFIEGSWVLGVHVADPEEFAKVLKGEYNGYSMYGTGSRRETEIEIDVPDDGIIKGDTQATGDHTHEYSVKLAKDGTYLGGHTSPHLDGHTHKITKGAATESNGLGGHTHRFDFLGRLLRGG